MMLVLRFLCLMLKSKILRLNQPVVIEVEVPTTTEWLVADKDEAAKLISQMFGKYWIENGLEKHFIKAEIINT